MHRKGAQDAKRAKLFTRLLRDITIAARENNESKLRVVIENAKKNNVPKKNIDNAIKSQDNVGELIRYEGFVYGVGIMIEVITDNKNRTAASVRAIFNKYKGSMSSTIHLFCNVYVALHEGNEDSVLQKAIELNCDQYREIDKNKWIIISQDNEIGEKIYIPETIITDVPEGIESMILDIQKIPEVQDIWTQLCIDSV